MYRFTTTMITFAMGLGFQLAHAAPPQNLPSRVVQFADLDLSHTQGAAALYQRLKRAAETVCGPFDLRDLGQRVRFESCVSSAISAAVAKVDRPALTAYYKAHTSSHNSTIQTAQNQAR